MGFRSLFARWGMLALVAGLSACSPQILGEKLSEQCDLKGFTYSQSVITAVKIRETVSSIPSFSEGVPLGFEISPALPTGISFDPDTGIISGVATSVSASQIYTVRATSPSQCSVTQILRLRITGTDPIRSNLGVNRTQTPVGTSPDTTVTLTLLDSNGQPVVGNQVALTSNRAQDVITATGGSVTDANGVATFTLHSTLSGTATLTAVDVTDLETLSTIGQMDFTPGAAVRVAAIGIPSTMVAGLDLAAEIQAVDTYGNRDTGFNGVVRVSHNDSWTQSVGAGPLTLNLVNGKADYVIKLTHAQATAITSQHLPASGPALSTGVLSVQVSPGPLDPSKTEIISATTTLTAGQDYSFEIEPRDAYGNSKPSLPPVASDLSWVIEESSIGSIQTGPLTWSEANQRFSSMVTGWTAGRLDVAISIQGTEGPARTLTVNPGPVHHLSLENLPRSISAGEPITNLSVTAFDVADNRTNPAGRYISTYIDSNCLVPTPGRAASNTNRPELVYDSDTQSATFDALEIYNTKTRYLRIDAMVPFCSEAIEVTPGHVSAANSYITFDHFPFLGNTEFRNHPYPVSKPAPMRVVVLDSFRNPIPDTQVQVTQSRDFNRSFFATLDPKDGTWSSLGPEIERITLTTDQDGISRFQVGSGEIQDVVVLSASVDIVNRFNPGTIRFQNGADNWNTGNLQKGGLVTSGFDPTPLVQPIDTPSPPANHPAWMVAVTLTNPDHSSSIICPGVILTWYHVLTPASCLIERASGITGELKIQAGSYWDSSVSTLYRQTRAVRTIKIDPSYHSLNPVSDLAVIDLKSPLTENPFVKRVDFKEGPIAGMQLATYSWHKSRNYFPYTPSPSTEASSFLLANEELMTQSVFTQSGITNGSTTFSMDFLTLGSGGRSTDNRLITTGQYAVIAGDLNHFLGFTVAGGDFREPHTERLTVDTAIRVERTHPFIADLLHGQ